MKSSAFLVLYCELVSLESHEHALKMSRYLVEGFLAHGLEGLVVCVHCHI